MPMIPELAISLLACARIGAIHSVVFGGFSPEALASRITDCGAKLVVTADEGPRGGKPVALKENVNRALEIAGDRKTLVVKRTGAQVFMKDGRDHYYKDLTDQASEICLPEIIILPLDGVSNKDTKCKNVDLPDPEGPTIATTFPVSIFKLIFFKTVIFELPFSKCFDKLFI